MPCYSASASASAPVEAMEVSSWDSNNTVDASTQQDSLSQGREGGNWSWVVHITKALMASLKTYCKVCRTCILSQMEPQAVLQEYDKLVSESLIEDVVVGIICCDDRA